MIGGGRTKEWHDRASSKKHVPWSQALLLTGCVTSAKLFVSLSISDLIYSSEKARMMYFFQMCSPGPVLVCGDTDIRSLLWGLHVRVRTAENKWEIKGKHNVFGDECCGEK